MEVMCDEERRGEAGEGGGGAEMAARGGGGGGRVRYAEMVARGGGRTEEGKDMQELWREEVGEGGRGKICRDGGDGRARGKRVLGWKEVGEKINPLAYYGWKRERERRSGVAGGRGKGCSETQS